MLQDLWALGSDPQKTVDLIRRNISRFPSKIKVLELCCGKGASLISVARIFNINGVGIDLYQPFINEAIEFSRNENVSQSIDFQVMNIKEVVEYFSDFNLVIFGYDTEILGDESETLKQIKKCCTNGGYIIFETAHHSFNELMNLISKTELVIVDKFVYKKNEIKQINSFNTEKIRQRAEDLIIEHPIDEELFKTYVTSQAEESLELENSLCWVILLLHNN